MQPNTSSIHNSDIPPVWIIGSDDSIPIPTSTQFRFEACHFGGILESVPAVIVLDPDSNKVDFCIDQIRLDRERFGEVPIVIYSSWSDAASVFPLVKVGINGFLLKDSKQSLDDVIHAAIMGGVPFSSRISALLLGSVRCHLPVEVKDFNLNTREIEMLQLMSEGMTKKEISKKFGNSIHTVDNHVRKIYLKMAVNNLGQAVGNAFRAGLIS